MTKKKPEVQEEIMSEEKQIPPTEIAAQTMLGDLMNLAIENAKALPKSWQELNEFEQGDYLHRIEMQCRDAVRQCVQIIASGGCVRIPIQIKSCTIKDSVVVQAELVSASHVIDLVSMGSKMAMLVLANSDEFVTEEGKPTAEKDQRSLELGHEYTDGDGLTEADLIGGHS
jgi:hypothetical protein